MEHSAERLRHAIDRPDCAPTLIVGVHDALAGKQAEYVGFNACWVSSFGISATLGLPDQNLVGSAEMAAVAHRIALATRLPLLVDGDNGYGSALAMKRAALEFDAAGAAGMCVEDSVFPKRNSFDPGRDDALFDSDEFASRITATKAALRGSPFVLVARTEALIAGRSVDVALQRARQYAAAGADLLVVHTKDSSGREAIEVARQWCSEGGVRLVSIPTAFPHLSAAELGALGYVAVVYANQLLRAAIAGIDQALLALLAGREKKLEEDIVPMQSVFRMTRY